MRRRVATRKETVTALPAQNATPLALGNVQAVVGLFAGVAALIYLTGGAVLGLRLLWAGLPALPVGQMPRDFLFSLGAAQVVLPALALGLVGGLLELGHDQRGLKEGHKPWTYANQTPELRQTYIAFYGAIPFVVISPAIAIAIATDDDVDHKTIILVGLGLAASLALAVWIGFARRSRLKRRPYVPFDPCTRRGLEVLGWIGTLTSVFLAMILAGAIWLFEQNARYLGIIGAAVVALFFALLVVWLRGIAGSQHRRHPRAEGVAPVLVILSWTASALMAVPALIAVSAAWPLTNAVVCAERVDKLSYTAAGLFVGETKDRVYIGDDRRRRIISVPTTKVSRLLVGGHAMDAGACKRGRDVRR